MQLYKEKANQLGINLPILTIDQNNCGGVGQTITRYKYKSAFQPGLTGELLLLSIFTPSQFPLRQVDTNCTVTKSCEPTTYL